MISFHLKLKSQQRQKGDKYQYIKDIYNDLILNFFFI